MAYKCHIILLLLWSLHNLSTYRLILFFLTPAAAKEKRMVRPCMLYTYLYIQSQLLFSTSWYFYSCSGCNTTPRHCYEELQPGKRLQIFYWYTKFFLPKRRTFHLSLTCILYFANLSPTCQTLFFYYICG